MSRLKRSIEAVSLKAFQVGALRRAAFRAAAARGHGIALLYHRVGTGRAVPREVVRTLPTPVFRRQLEVLGELGDIVPLLRLLEPPDSYRRMRFAITFDDDDPEYVVQALPVLQSLGVHATFFLSGRSLHGLGPYWWELMEFAIAKHGVERLGEMLGVPARRVGELVAACEGSPLADRLTEIVSSPSSAREMQADGIRELAQAGMEIGFHTLHHPVLVGTSIRDVDSALIEGRDELAAAAGKRVDFLAYPHGKADEMVAERAEAAGYRAAFTNLGFAIHGDSHRFLLGRWDTRLRDGDEFVRSLALRLSRPIGGPRR